MQQLQNQSVLILGLGDSGLAMARWCVRQGAQVQVVDTRAEPPQLATLCKELPEVNFVHGSFDAKLVHGQNIRAVFKSPGLSPLSVAPVWDAALQAGIWVGTELTLFAHALEELKVTHAYHPKVLAITGTNGKTTVTSLTGQLLERAGLRVAVAGNIGPTLLDTLADRLKAAELNAAEDKAKKEQEKIIEQADTVETKIQPKNIANDAGEGHEEELGEDEESSSIELNLTPLVPPPPPPPDHPYLPQVWVLELSSFQLECVETFEPTAATVLNLSQDHLDWHGSMSHYGAAKARIFGQHGLMVLNRGDAQVMAMLPEPVRVKLQKPLQRPFVTFGGDVPQRPGDYGIESVNGMTWLVRALEADETRKRKKEEEEEIHIQRLMPADALRIRGRHNALNALSALALASATGANFAPMLFGLREYRGEPHRVEAVTVVDGVEYFDDSKGTNVGATVAALNGLGDDLSADRRIVVILGGDGKGQDFEPLKAPIALYVRAVVMIGRDASLLRDVLQHSGVTLVDAANLEEAVVSASKQARPGDVVLLSPACASLDMFRNYEHRAEVFVAAVKALAEEAGVSL